MAPADCGHEPRGACAAVTEERSLPASAGYPLGPDSEAAAPPTLIHSFFELKIANLEHTVKIPRGNSLPAGFVLPCDPFPPGGEAPFEAEQLA